MKNRESTYLQFVKKLEQFRIVEKRLLLYNRLSNFFTVFIPLFFIVLYLEANIDFSPGERYWLIAAFAVLFLVFLVLCIGPAVLRLLRSNNPTLNEIALRIGSFYQSVDDRLANALQVFQRYHDDPRYSAALIDESLDSVQLQIKKVNFKQHIDTSKAVKSIIVLLIIIVLFGITSLFNKGPLLTAFDQLVHPSKDMDTSRITFHIQPGDVTIVKDSDVELKAWISDSLQQQITVHTGDETQLLTKADDDTFYYHLAGIAKSMDYSFQVGEQVSDIHHIDVQDRPMLRYVQVTVTPPAYSGIAVQKLDDNVGDISALKGTRVNIEGRPNKDLDSAAVVFSSGNLISMNNGERTVQTAFTIRDNDRYHFDLVDTYGFASDNPIEYTIRVLPDQYPVIRLIHPGQDVDLTDEMILPLIMEAHDDYGIRRISLVYQVIPAEGEIDSSRFMHQELEGIDYNQDQLRIALNWDLNDSDMLPTEQVVYYIEVYDNDSVSGPKRAFTPMFRARFPSLYEMYQEIAETQDETIREMEDVYEKRREFDERVETLSRELQRAEELDWERQQQAEQALQQQQEIQQQMKELEKNLDEMVEKMKENDLASPETLEKYNELQDLYQEIMTPELEELMRDMAESLTNMDKSMLQKAMKDFQMSDEDISKSLERTIALLKRLKIEQQIDQAIKMANDMAERQQDLQERTENGESADERLQREQENIRKDKEAMSKDLDELRKQMSEMPQMPMDDLDKAQAELESDSLAQSLENMENMLQSGNMNEFKQQSQKMQNTMKSVAQNLQKAKEKMDGTQQQKAMAAMRKNVRQLLELSKQQEDLMQQTESLPQNASGIQEVADHQNNMLSGLHRVINSIFELSKESMMLDTEMQSALGKAELDMEETLELLENRNNRQASQKQGESMMSMNDAILLMQKSMQSMMQSQGGGMSFEQFMQQMQQMAKSQQQLNQSTQEMSGEQQQAMARQAQMGRLAAQQQGLRKSMEQLAKEAGDASDILGDLDQIAKDMKEVEQDLGSNNISRETLQRQNRILSRMLDAQRSMRQREYSRQRRAETGKNYTVPSPGELPEDLGERETLLQQELLQAKRQGFSQDYLNLIKDYFNALTEQEREDTQAN